MKKILKFEWDRMIHSRSMWIACIAVSLIVIADFGEAIKYYRQGYNVGLSVFYMWLGVNSQFYTGAYLFMTLPILASLGYSWSACYDRNSGYINSILTRTSRFRYYTSKYIVAFTSGGMIFAGSLILHFLLMSTLFPTIAPVPGDLCSFMDPFHFCSDLFYRNTYLFMIVWILTAFGWGGAIASISLFVGMIIKKSALTPVISFIVFNWQQILAVFIDQKYQIMYRDYHLGIVWNDLLYSGSYVANPADILWGQILIIIISTLIGYSVRGRKYECL